MVTADDDALSRRVGQRVRAIRKRRRLTQADLAYLIDRSVEAISAVERGRSAPSLATLVRLARALDIRPGDLFDDAAGPDLSPVRAGIMAGITDRLRTMEDRNLHIADHLIKGLSDC